MRGPGKVFVFSLFCFVLFCFLIFFLFFFKVFGVGGGCLGGSFNFGRVRGKYPLSSTNHKYTPL